MKDSICFKNDQQAPCSILVTENGKNIFSPLCNQFDYVPELKEWVHPGSFTLHSLLQPFVNYLELMPSEGRNQQIGILSLLSDNLFPYAAIFCHTVRIRTSI